MFFSMEILATSLVRLLIADQRRGTRVAETRISGGADDRRRWLERIVRVAVRESVCQSGFDQRGRQQRHVELRVAVAEVADRARRKRARPRRHQVPPLHVIVAGEARFVAADVAVERVRNDHAAPVGRVAEEQRVLGAKADDRRARRRDACCSA